MCLYMIYLRTDATSCIQIGRQSEIPAPWATPPPWTQLLHDESAGGLSRFHRIDVWHTVHMGVGKPFLAGAVCLLQHVTGETSVDKRVAVLNDDFQQWCQGKNKTKYIRKLEHSTFGLKQREPNGSWNKAHVTSTLMEWMDDFIDRHRNICEANEDLKFIVP